MQVNQQREDYLTIIFKLQESDKKISNKSISEALNISPASVTEMLKKLKADNLIEDTKNIKLTNLGEEITKNILSKHRLWETFFMKVLDYNWADVHENAKKFQSVTNDEMLNRLNEFLGYPEYCPHGSTIYINNEEIDEDLINLSQAKVNTNYIVRRIRDERSLLMYLNKLGIKMGQKIKVLDFEQFDDSAIVEIDSKKVNISAKACKLIFLKEAHH